MKNRRTTMWKLLALVAVLAVAATISSSAGVAAREQQSVTLVWWHNVTQGAGLQLYKDIVTEFQKRNPNVTIKAVPLQNEQFQTKIPIALQSDSPPDVFQSWGGGGLVDQQKAGKVADLTRYVRPWIKSLGGSAAGWQVNGRQYAVPYSVGVVGFWYNRQLFRQAGIGSAPKTWPQFLAAIAKLKEAGITPIAVGSKDEWPDAFYWDYLAVKLCSKNVMQQSAVTYNFRAVPGRIPRNPGAAGRFELCRLARQRQGGDGAHGPLEPGRDAGSQARWQDPELPRLVPVPECPGQQGSPRLDARRG
jgi:raffinose/stachyose/melibiose transport system substrate-binding protein